MHIHARLSSAPLVRSPSRCAIWPTFSVRSPLRWKQSGHRRALFIRIAVSFFAGTGFRGGFVVPVSIEFAPPSIGPANVIAYVGDRQRSCNRELTPLPFRQRDDRHRAT